MWKYHEGEFGWEWTNIVHTSPHIEGFVVHMSCTLSVIRAVWEGCIIHLTPCIRHSKLLRPKFRLFEMFTVRKKHQIHFWHFLIINLDILWFSVKEGFKGVKEIRIISQVLLWFDMKKKTTFAVPVLGYIVPFDVLWTFHGPWTFNLPRTGRYTYSRNCSHTKHDFYHEYSWQSSWIWNSRNDPKLSCYRFFQPDLDKRACQNQPK